MSQASMCSRAMILTVALFGFAAASRPQAGQTSAPAGARAAGDRAPAFAATLIWDEAGEEPFRGAAVVVDADNSVIVVGKTGSARFPATGGAIKNTVTGATDVFVARFDAGLKTLLAATLVGGSGDEGDCDVALGPQGDIYIAGSTTSKDFPPGASMLDSGSDDARSRTFVARISRDLSRLLSAAVLSRESAPRTGATRVVFDHQRQRVLVGGTTANAAFPVTAGAFQARMGSDQGTKFVAILDPGLTRLLAATLLGGKAREGAVNGLLADRAGNVFVGSSTFSSDYPTTGRAFQRVVGPGQVWGAVSKLSPDLTTLLASTFVGDTGNDFVYSIALDRQENVVFAGHVFETMPTTPNAYLRAGKGIPDMANVGILSTDLSTLVASTFVCGGGEGSFYGGYSYFGGLAVGQDGSIFVAGTSDMPFFPTTPGTFDDTQNGARDVVVVKMRADLSSLEASTFLGGRGRDLYGDIALDRAGRVVVVGATTSSDFPTSTGAYQTGFAGRQATFVGRFGPDLADPERLPAHAAARGGDLAGLKAGAGSGGAELRRLDRYGRLPLHWAARYGRLDAVRWLAGQGADLNAQDGEGNTPLHLAALRGELAAAELLASLGAALDRPNTAGDAPLHLAALAGHDHVVRHFVARKAALDVKNGLGNTPLHRAAFSRHRDVVATLLGGGASPSLKNQAGNTPLHLAVTVYRNDDTVALLVKAGAAVDEVNARLQTPLHAAAGYSWQGNAIELLKAGPGVNRQDADGRTPLHQAVSGDLRQTVKALLAQGADPSIKDAKGKSALDLAEDAKMTPMVELLKGAVKR